MRGRREALVCEYIERLPSDSLERYAELIREMVGRRHGVYALYRKGKLYYAGLATNLRGRLKQHLRDRHRGLWDAFSVYLTIDIGHLRELESLVIRIALPAGNKQRGRLARSENLMPHLRRMLRERHNRELSALTSGTPRPERDARLARTERARVPARELARYLTRPLTLRARHKGRIYVARALRDGTIRVKSQVVGSPSVAASLITGTAVNGWRFWRYQRAPGEWVPLIHMRRR